MHVYLRTGDLEYSGPPWAVPAGSRGQHIALAFLSRHFWNSLPKRPQKVPEDGAPVTYFVVSSVTLPFTNLPSFPFSLPSSLTPVPSVRFSNKLSIHDALLQAVLWEELRLYEVGEYTHTEIHVYIHKGFSGCRPCITQILIQLTAYLYAASSVNLKKKIDDLLLRVSSW